VSLATETRKADAPGPTQAAAAAAADLPVTVIEPTPGWRVVNWRELWRYRELLYFLTWRDIKVRYKQTALGAAWAILQPLATMVVFSLFIGRLAGVEEKVKNYPLFVFAGLLPWTFFANALGSAGQSVVGSQNLVTKVYFPRLLIPTGAVAAGLVDLAIGLVLLLPMMFYYRVAPGWNVFLAPAVLLLLVLSTLGVGTMLAALTVAYRDFRHAVPFTVQLWMFATPCIYLPAETFGPLGHRFLPLNPTYGLIYNFRQTVLGGTLDWYSLSISGVIGLAMLVVGCLYFRRVERHFADII
jgi:lipopolysaccharide transport system permease protein